MSVQHRWGSVQAQVVLWEASLLCSPSLLWLRRQPVRSIRLPLACLACLAPKLDLDYEMQVTPARPHLLQFVSEPPSTHGVR